MPTSSISKFLLLLVPVGRVWGRRGTQPVTNQMAPAARLVVDYDRQPMALSAIRASGEHVEIAGMSEGTRDQLYLALRLAALEEHGEKASALPFVADDLFINFDDGRARAGLRVLAHIAKRTQVIFLSHHDHLVDIVRDVFGPEVNVRYMG